MSNAAIKTFKFFEGKRYRLSWVHHKEIAHMLNMPEKTKHLVMKEVEERQMSVGAMRKACGVLKDKIKVSKDKTGYENPETFPAIFRSCIA